MVRKCCVLSCNGDAKFKFPATAEAKRNWLVAINRPKFNPKSSKAGLCGKHFKEEDFLFEGLDCGKFDNLFCGT